MDKKEKKLIFVELRLALPTGLDCREDISDPDKKKFIASLAEKINSILDFSGEIKLEDTFTAIRVEYLNSATDDFTMDQLANAPASDSIN